MELHDNTDNRALGATRVAFPAYRVFVYGKELTQDVFEVSVNNSGGSVERAAGTASFSLVNQSDKYTLTFEDMHAIGKHAHAYASFVRRRDWDVLGFDDAATLPLYAISDADLFNEEAKDLSTEEIKILSSKRFDPSTAMTAEEKARYDRSYVSAYKKDANLIEQGEDLDKTYAEYADNITKASFANPYSATNLAGWHSSDFGSAGAFKAEVLEDKLKFITEIKYNPNSNMDKLQDRVIFEYPMQQGDAIFHANDPVRICFRDPFDPRIWYWQFTGFVDVVSDSEDENGASMLTIACTDVTKMARYSYIQQGTGMQDANIENIVLGLQAQAKTGAVFMKELFQNFTMLDVLQSLFFGTEATLETREAVIDAQLAAMPPQNLEAYLRLAKPDTLDPDSFTFLKTVAEQREYVKALMMESWQKALSNLEIPPLSVPAPYMRGVDKAAATRGSYTTQSPTVIAKRFSAARAVSSYFYGELSDWDLQVGDTMNSLFAWNELLHHRVRPSDLTTMAMDPEMYRDVQASFENLPPSSIMEIIGKDLKTFPVGHGHVFYLSRARFATGEFGRNIIDKAIGGASGLYSVFKDKLSFIYDMAERADFGFYATPRGDFVYEMPFYDFDPYDFVEADSQYYKDSIDKLLEFEEDYRGMGFYENPDDQSQVRIPGINPEYDYARAFTIEKVETGSSQKTVTDRGIFTVFRCRPHIAASNSNLDSTMLPYEYAVEKGGVPTLGVRVTDTDSWGFVDSKEGAQAFAALTLARINAEAKVATVPTVSKFGMMVNRPVFWRAKNYYGNVVSLQHSIIWNSSADTSIIMNSLRGWSGEVDQTTGKLVHRHFSGTDRPFSMAAMSEQQNQNAKNKG